MLKPQSFAIPNSKPLNPAFQNRRIYLKRQNPSTLNPKLKTVCEAAEVFTDTHHIISGVYALQAGVWNLGFRARDCAEFFQWYSSLWVQNLAAVDGGLVKKS